MRPKIVPLAVLLSMICICLIGLLSGPSEAVSFDDYEIPPGAPRWFTLQDFDERGDILELTIVFKKTENGSFQERPIDILIVESYIVERNSNIERARSEAIFIRENVENRLELIGEGRIINTMNEKMAIVFFNEQQDGDRDRWDEATVKIRVDYTVENAVKEKSNLILILIIILLIIMIIGGSGGLIYYVMKRRIKDNRTFFNPEGALFYVFKDIDGSIFYFTEQQYTQMYNQHALVTYEYLGQAMKKGGEVMIPLEEVGMYDEGVGPVFAQPATPIPLDTQPMAQIYPAEPLSGTGMSGASINDAQDLYSQDMNSRGMGFYDQDSIGEDGSDETGLDPEGLEDGSQGVLDELVSHATTISVESEDDTKIMKLGDDEDREQTGK